MASLNKVMIIGNLTRDPEVKYTPKGQAIAEISLAVNRSYSTSDGEKREEVTYLEVTFWGKQAEVLGQWMKKGRPLYVEGRLRLDSWEDKETGKKQSRLRITGEEFQFLGSKNEGGGGGQTSYQDEGAPSRGNSGGGYPQNRSQGSSRSQNAPGYDDGPPRGSSSKPDAFPPGPDDDEIPF